jgi:hypothetical protein
MTEAEILALSETDHTPGLHRTETLKNRARVSLGDAWLMLRGCAQLKQLNPFRFVGPGYQEEIET